MNPVLYSLLVAVLIFTVVIPSFVLANDPVSTSNSSPTTTLIDDSKSDSSEEIDPDIVKGTGLCVGGAIIGSIVPILGTAIGCGVGVAYAWFTRVPE